MTVKFTQEDLKIFSIPGFKERMAAIKGKIRPKLEQLGEELGPSLMNQFKREMFAFTAKHMRRTVNPPDETWVAFGPNSRGYKAYVYFAFVVGRNGAQARVVMKTESNTRPAFGENLLANKKYFEKHSADFSNLQDYTRRDSDYGPTKISKLDSFLEETGSRLVNLKSAQLDLGLELKPLSSSLEQEILKSFDKLFPFYECGRQAGVRFR